MSGRYVVDALRPAAYNPREADEQRLQMVALSLRKLGWLLPIYASESEDGGGGMLEILSGHQRHMVASARLGAHWVPVELVPAMDLAQRQLVNVAFNRGTNDLEGCDTSKTITAELAKANVLELAEKLPDLDMDSPEAMPCFGAKLVPIAELIPLCEGRWIPHAAQVADVLAGHGIRMPVVVAGGRVLNGIGRVQYAAQKGETHITVVEIPAERAQLAEAMMNLLSMDFAIHKRYGDLLRYSNARRRRSSPLLNLCMLYALEGKKTSKEFDPRDPKNIARWRRFYGETILDFGSGSSADTKIIRAMGVDCTPFEPWCYDLGGGENLNTIDRARSVEQTRLFLARIADGTCWSTIFMASVLNSVPFDSDRRMLIVLIASLTQPETSVYPVAASVGQAGWQSVSGREFLNFRDQEISRFHLDYEPRMTMTSFGQSAKTQRFFTPAEFYDLWSERFTAVRADMHQGLVRAWCRDPKPVPAVDLEAAIRFEFDLPFPDGGRMGLAEEAIAAWRARKVKLPHAPFEL